MSSVMIILWKELRDNLRDKRTMFFALLFGPILMPSLMLGMMVINVNKNIQHFDSGKELHVYGAERAPNLMQFLKSRNLDAKKVKDDFREKIVSGDLKLVIEVSENYGEKLLEGSPAKVTIHYNKEDHESQSYFWQVRGELDGYSRQVAALRMMIRGFDQSLLKPLDIAENDLSEEEPGSSVLAKMIIFLIVYSCMMGGFYLAVDITAGERERKSLEPLLSLPLTRTQIVMGKYLAIVVFCSVSYLLPLISSAIWISFLTDSFFGYAEIPNLITYLKLLALMFPVCILFAGALMAMAAFSKSVKEAQTQIGIAMILPFVPFFMVQFKNIRLDEVNSVIPVMNQYLYAEKIMMDSSYSLAAIVPGAVATFALAAVFLVISVWLYKRDAILG